MRYTRLNRSITPTPAAQFAQPRARKRRAQFVGSLLILTLAGFGVSACTIDNSDQSAQSTKTQEAPVDEAKITISMKDKAQEVGVNDPLEVTSSKPIKQITVTAEDGAQAKGKFNKDKTKWSYSDGFRYGITYTVDVSSGDQTKTISFTTQHANNIATNAMAPLDGSTVGVGQSISVRFDTPIQNRQAVQDAITVETSPKTEGAFYWITASEVRWRPKEFWKPGTKVSVSAKLRGIDLGNGTYTDEDRSAKFTIGDDVRAVVDDATKTMTITKNGKQINSMPVSNGQDNSAYSTPNGIYQIGDQYESLVMDSNTYGLSPANGGYVTPVNYATQMSYSGIYIHGAPWSVWAQGSQNTSHGCVNVSDANAQWVYNNMKRGDIVVVKNTTGGTLSGSDGLGDWNIDWKTWKKGNADGDQ